MKILSKLVSASLVLSLPLSMIACGEDDPMDGGMGGATGTGASNGSGGTGTGGNDGDGGTPGTGGGGGNTATAPFSLSDCTAAEGPAASVTGLTDAGAFVDGGDWMDGWTNWSIDSTPEDDGSAPDEVVDADITTDTTWSADTIYSLDAPVNVEAGATLTIEPGTLIKSSPQGSLVISRGGMIDAQGTAEAPIVFTSTAANGSKAKGDWGGVIILGNAQNWNDEELIEGLADEPENYHGGDDDADNSGTMKYVRIEFGGTELTPGNEINGLTLGSIGSGTSLSYIQVNTTLDDGIEWFGGMADADHLVVNNAGDDLFDGDLGFRGELSYLFGRHIAPLSGDPNGFEMDGDNEATDLAVAVNTTIDTVNSTICGAGGGGLNVSYGAVLRENLEGTHTSLVVVGFDAGFDLRDNVQVESADSWSWGHDIGLCDPDEDDNDDGVDDCAWFEDVASNTSL